MIFFEFFHSQGRKKLGINDVHTSQQESVVKVRKSDDSGSDEDSNDNEISIYSKASLGGVFIPIMFIIVVPVLFYLSFHRMLNSDTTSNHDSLLKTCGWKGAWIMTFAMRL